MLQTFPGRQGAPGSGNNPPPRAAAARLGKGGPITEKPDALSDRPDLDRLYARVEDEYELRERFDALNRKLAVIAETTNTLADIIDTERSLRLELIVVDLIAFEIVITFYQIFAAA